MGGFFGTISKQKCVNDLFYGTDYNSHMGTKKGGLATYDPDLGFMRSIHNLQNAYFRSKFEDELDKFKGNAGIGVISDTDAQPLVINSHLGRFAIVTVAKVQNLYELETDMLSRNMHLAELSSGVTNQTELIALLIIQGKDYVDGIENVFRNIKGSCSMLLLTEDGIIAARDRLGRTPVVIGRKDGAYAVTSETCSFPNLDYEIERDLGPGEIVRLLPDGVEQLRRPEKRMPGCITVSLHRAMKERTLRRSASGADTRWGGRTPARLTASAAYLIRVSGRRWDMPRARVSRTIGPSPNTHLHGRAVSPRAARSAGALWPR